MTHEERLNHLYKLLKARTKHDGKPLNINYAPNVTAIKAEIEKLEERITAIALLEGGE